MCTSFKHKFNGNKFIIKLTKEILISSRFEIGKKLLVL